MITELLASQLINNSKVDDKYRDTIRTASRLLLKKNNLDINDIQSLNSLARRIKTYENLNINIGPHALLQIKKNISLAKSAPFNFGDDFV